MVSIKEQIEKNIRLYMSLKNIFYVKSKDIDKNGNVSIKEDYIRASVKFGLKNPSTSDYDDQTAEDYIGRTKLQITTELLGITKVILKQKKLYDMEKSQIETLEAENKDHKKIFDFCLEKLIETQVISPHDTIEYEPIYDKEGSVLGAKLMTEEQDEEEL